MDNPETMGESTPPSEDNRSADELDKLFDSLLTIPEGFKWEPSAVKPVSDNLLELLTEWMELCEGLMEARDELHAGFHVAIPWPRMLRLTRKIVSLQKDYSTAAPLQKLLDYQLFDKVPGREMDDAARVCEFLLQQEQQPKDDAAVVVETSKATNGPAAKQPSQQAFHAYWLEQCGYSQGRIAEMLKSNQGTISKWLAKVKRWKDEGNTMPEIPQNEPLHEKPIAMDPEKLGLGRRPDGRTEGQREKLAEIQGHGKE
jgi:hypothetical protein